MPLWLYHGHGDRPLDLEGEEAAVVELGSVVAHQADFSPVNAASSELELEVVLDPALGRDREGRGAGLPGTVQVQLQMSLLDDFRCVEQFHGGSSLHTGDGNGRIQIQAGDGHVGLWGPIAVDDYYGNPLEFIRLGGLIRKRIRKRGQVQFLRSTLRALWGNWTCPLFRAQETFPGEFLQVGNDVDLFVPGVAFGQ